MAAPGAWPLQISAGRHCECGRNCDHHENYARTDKPATTAAPARPFEQRLGISFGDWRTIKDNH
jgi:hypothetical protein